ncbi:response regulator [Phaeovulum sp.]|uniref:response regulator n=1 Tax=Phaeovulum sp. TaxID=2934796 RepID=UPI003561EB8D
MQVSIADKLAQERRARLAAERLLEQTKAELFAANQKLAQHARALSDQIVAQRHGLARAQAQTESLLGENTRVRGDLELATSAAQIAKRRLWDALETIHDGFAVFDHELRLVVANRAYLAFFDGHVAVTQGVGYDAVLKLMAQHEMVALDGREPLDWHREMMARVRRAKIVPYVLRLANGRYLRLADRWGGEGDLVCLVQDITKTMARETELDTARAEAEAANRAKSAFLANMSHEIRTPMSGVVGMAELLCETTLNEEQRLFAETIKSSGEALLKIINEVLDYSKIEADKLLLYPEVFDLERCLHEIMVLLGPSARDKGLKLLVDYDLSLPTRFVADPGRMRQVLTNLIGNAVKFTPAGHVLARVVGQDLGDGRFDLQMTVEDTGIGIAPEYIEHVLGKFNQVESASNRKFEGTGLGLAITRQLVELMGGTIWLESELGRGSCFGLRLTVPVAEPHEAIIGPVAPITLKAALVVEELSVNRDVLERQLQTYGLLVTVCRTGAEALDAVAAGTHFDVVLIDQQTPDMDGLQLVQRLRDKGMEAPILLLTTNPDQAAIGAMQGELAAALEKPVMRSDLFRSLQDISHPAAVAPPQGPTAPRQMRVLAAEDNRTNQLVFRKMVKDYDIDLQFAGNGREALELWQHWRPDLVFMDISMPEMDGCEAARAIRDQEQVHGLRRTPIVALTAHAMEGDAESILAAGIDRYLTKPLKKREIAEQLAAYCPQGARCSVAEALPE